MGNNPRYLHPQEALLYLKGRVDNDGEKGRSLSQIQATQGLQE